MLYWSVTASQIRKAANVTAKECCSQILIFVDSTTCLRTPLAETPYKMKTINVRAMNMTYIISISDIGDETFGEIKNGRKARKNIERNILLY